ncbi:MAG: hypothetical protein SPJ34_03010 [Candidatus Ornithospirochaeta sp.]|nr:hypothetical protein [Candidatus Ornithospirochaeta sp.]
MIIGLLRVSCLILIASCSDAKDTKPASWLLNKTWSGTVKTTLNDVPQESEESYSFDDKGIKLGGMEGAKISYLTNGDTCEVSVYASATNNEGQTGTSNIVYRFTRISETECKLEGTMTGKIDGTVTTSGTKSGTLTATPTVE